MSISGIRGATEMGMNFTVQESSAICGLLAESTSDIIIKSDLAGTIVSASPGL